MTRLTAHGTKELALRVWRYFAAHPEVRCKDGLPPDLFAQIKDMALNCPLCEFFFQSTDPMCFFCDRCPLSSCMDGGLYTAWAHSQSCEERSFHAHRIVGAIEAWRLE